ncbi:hypothetical protein Aduo_012735 [Ancylostoma duodenale]
MYKSPQPRSSNIRSYSSGSRSRNRRHSVDDSRILRYQESRGSKRNRSPTPYTKRSRSRDANISVNIASTAQEDEAEEVVQLNSVNISTDSPSRLVVTKLILSNPISQEKEQVHAILDTGATRSFVSSALADRLNLPSSQESFYIRLEPDSAAEVWATPALCDPSASWRIEGRRGAATNAICLKLENQNLSPKGAKK